MRPIFPMKYLNITQGHRGGTHKAGFPIDIAGKDTGIDDVFAPFDGMINKIYEPNNSALGHTVWLESLAPVAYADGTIDFATIMLTHDNAVTDLRVGQIIKQGQVFYQEGTAGFATGNHVHLEVARGKMSGIGWQQVNGSWIITNPYEPHKMFFLSDTIIINGFGYPWKELETKMIIQDAPNWFGRCDKTMYQIRGRALGKAEFKNHAVGAEFLNWVEAVSDNPEADTATRWQDVGRIATAEKWAIQISDLTKALAAKPKEVQVPVEVIKEVTVEKIVEVVKGDDDRSLGDLLSAAFKKLFKIK